MKAMQKGVCYVVAVTGALLLVNQATQAYCTGICNSPAYESIEVNGDCGIYQCYAGAGACGDKFNPDDYVCNGKGCTVKVGVHGGGSNFCMPNEEPTNLKCEDGPWDFFVPIVEGVCEQGDWLDPREEPCRCNQVTRGNLQGTIDGCIESNCPSN